MVLMTMEPSHHHDGRDDDLTVTSHQSISATFSLRSSGKNKNHDRIQKICIFELPYNWDPQRLPPTEWGDSECSGGRSNSKNNYNNNKKKCASPCRNTMWAKSYITTAMVDDDLSALDLDIEETPGWKSVYKHKERDERSTVDTDLRSPIKSEMMARLMQLVSNLLQRSTRSRGKGASSMTTASCVTTPLCFQCPSTKDSADEDDSSTETVATYRWISPSTFVEEQQKRHQRLQASMTKTCGRRRITLRQGSCVRPEGRR